MALASDRRAVATATALVGSACRLSVLATTVGTAAGAFTPSIAVALGVVPAGNAGPAFPAAEPSVTDPGEPGELDEPVPLDDELVPGDDVEPLPDPVAALAELIVD